MPYVRFIGPYSDFIKSRDVSEAIHKENGSPGTLGFVEIADLRAGDEEIDLATYEAEKNSIQIQNAAIPPRVRSTIPTTLEQKLEGLTDIEDVKQALVDHFEKPREIDPSHIITWDLLTGE